ncbi:mannitol dehydrogenase family protein [Altererythrobacter sp. Root672]|uniref:mannitol dehydrogenase family protein n=1 Tax=Altererythrobacter sp. Root672 TaxID=1736584 RepID=UPI000701AAD2|nr:mannitol dehydrogenase family protein [Altererythrobacter sp. Root672]KRA80584.1 mannitol dehydrogenase [Altererythrobacter sp. Root672]
MRLSATSLDHVPPGIARYSYERAAQEIGIVHFGLGAFHRAHQAWYTDLCMDAGERGWAISGVSLRSPTVAEQLNPQDGLYTLTERSGDDSETRVIGAVREVLVAAQEPEKVIARLGSQSVSIVSFTVTEKGYARRPGGSLDLAAAEASFYPLLTQGLRLRREHDLPGLTLVSCDNLPANGRELERLFGEWLAERAPDLAAWVAAECAFPSTMVDRIVPATTPADIDWLEGQLGVRDEGAIFTERFSQWVIEDRFAGPRPRWERHGAQLVRDVEPYETAKLRMLNGAHSALAYCGLELGYEFVHEAIADPMLRGLVERLMRQEAATSLSPAPGQDLEAYADALIARFADPALNHRLIQIAMDGSQKIPQRWLETLAYHQRRGAPCPALIEALAAWLKHVRGDRRPVDDPMATQLVTLWANTGSSGIAAALFGPQGLFAQTWQGDEATLARLTRRLG